MPLYTYVVSYKGSTHVAQGSHSNFKGFASTWSTFPPGALPALTPTLQRELAGKAYHADFPPIPNLRHAWRTAVEVGGSELVVIVVETTR